MSSPAGSRWDHETRSLACLAFCVSLFAFLAFFRRGEILLYGDAVAHLNIARRVFDSRTPGLLQLGTVWLPLPHLLMIPFLLPQKMWQDGIGGSIPSLIAYIFGVVGIFRLVRGALSPAQEPTSAARVAAWVAALVFAANPNLIYMQCTAMGESLYLALFLWAVVYFRESVRGENNGWIKCALCLAAACLTRYDGWFLAAGMAFSALVVYLCRYKSGAEISARKPVPISRSVLVKFILIASLAPALWFAYNAIVYRNPLEFENGPYSAKAIEKRTQGSASPGHPGTGNLYVASSYFLKSAEFNLAENQGLQRLWLLLMVGALAVSILGRSNLDHSKIRAGAGGVASKSARARLPGRFLFPLLFLLVPLPFYALSVAYGGVPIFLPAWWPFTHYNARYGLQLLPAFATAAGLLVYWGWNSNAWRGLMRRVALLAVLALTFASYLSIWQAGPICLREAQINMRGRNALESQLASWLTALPSNSTLLMYVGDHVGALERAGIPLSHVINEGNHRSWKQPTDPQGMWEQALADPVAHADFALAFEGDPVWQAVHERHYQEVVEVEVSGQARGVLYRLR